jgi:Ras-related protein Rab-1A
MAELLEIRHLNPNICALFKIALVGEISVGKTSVVRAFKRKNFIPLVRPTIGYDFEYIDEVRNGNAYRLEMWDTAGEERYQSVSKSHYKSNLGLM